MPTSPAPDAAAPPGMCPGVVVLGGGGGGGGGSGDGSGGGDSKSGGGDGSGDGASGDGKGAADGSGCGGSGNGKCPVHNSSASRGDPVDVVTGRVFTVPVLDLGLRGPLPLAIDRSYSSPVKDRDVGLGFGWSHSLGWEIEVRRLEGWVWKPNGTRVVFPRLEVGSELVGRDGYLLRRSADRFELDTGDDLIRVFAVVHEDAKRLRLIEVRDRNGNRIGLRYEAGRLIEIVDSVGRVVRARTTPEDRIAAFEAQERLPGAADGPWVTFVSYTYDEAGDLVAVTDGDGYVTRFRYEHHRLVEQVLPTGLTFHYRYDGQGRCIETWGDYPGAVDPSLAAGVSKYLYDGITKAKGALHYVFEYGSNGYSEVLSSVGNERFFGNAIGKLDKTVAGGGVTTQEYDDKGFLVVRTNPLGATTTWKRDERGRVLSITDALGYVTAFERNAEGRLAKASDPNGAVTSFEYDARGNASAILDPLGHARTYRYDARGLLTEHRQENGGQIRFEYDAHGNWTSATFPNGGTWSASYDAWGRRLSVTTPLGGTYRYWYNAAGDVTAIEDPRGGLTQYAFDGLGQLTRAVDPDGRTYEFIWGGHRALCEIKKPDGSAVRFRYNREGWLVEIWNERGEVYRFGYDSGGVVTTETRFDGSKVRYVCDAVGQVIRHLDANERRTEMEYSLTGELLRRTFHDETSEHFEYDAIGNVIAGMNAQGMVRFERDLLGRVVREVQDFAGEAHTVESRFDALGDRVHRHTSLKHTEDIERDVMGFRERVKLDGLEEVVERHDLLGGRLEQWLPGGGLIQQVFDREGHVTRQRVTTTMQRQAASASQPAWVGAAPRSASVDQMIHYSPAGEVLGIWDQDRGTTRFEYDPIGRVVGALPERARAELFRYDPAGNPIEVGEGAPEREYGPGNRLRRRGATQYRWDENGRLAEKREAAPEGERIWSYRWTGRGLLDSVKTPDGTTVEFTYDAFARRVLKRVKPPRDAPRAEVVTRYVWDGDVLAHEQRVVQRDVLLDRAYCFAHGSFIPWAHGDRNGDGARTWVYYINDPAGCPDTLVDSKGEIACRLKRTLWGSLEPEKGARTTTPFRFQGQYEDEETGLSYNRFRYYDPEIARYISLDPFGPDAGLNGFEYAPSPLTWVDPLGLVGRGTHHATVTITGTNGRVRASNEIDSHMTPEQKATYNRSRAQTQGRGGPAASEMRRACHTERKVCDSPNGWAYEQNIKKGETLTIKGKYEPCKPCRDSMLALSDDRKCTVVYQPGMSGKPGTKWICRNGKVIRED